MQAMYSFHLFDNLFDERTRMIPDKLILSYIAYRVAHEPSHGNSLLRCIRRVAAVFEKTGSNSDREPSAIEADIRTILPPIGKRVTDILRWEGDVSEAEYEKYLFAAGIRVNSIVVVRQSLTKNNQLFAELDDLQSDNLIYGCYDRLLAHHGGKKTMSFLMTYGTPTVNRALRRTLFEGAARAGRGDIVRFIYDFKRIEVPWNFMGRSLESYEHTALYRAQNTASLEVLRFVAELRELYLNSHIDSERAEYSLDWCIKMGRLDTVKHAIQLGAHPRGHSSMGHPRDNLPIRKACMRGRTAIVEYLLACGAGSEKTIAAASEWGHLELVRRLLELGIPPTDALSKASAGGYLDVVRLLLDAGVDANETIGPQSPLAGAIGKEHTAMFTLLVERGADLYADGVAEACVQRAKEDGLHSMLLLLQTHGVNAAKESCEKTQPQ
jgi:hypothetical protein